MVVHAMIMKATLRTNTAINGMMARFNAFLTFGELSVVDDISSLDDSSAIRAIAISAPPTPTPSAVDIVIALEVALDTADKDVTDSIPGNSSTGYIKLI